MSNQYNTAHWSQNPMHYSSVQLEDEYQYTHITTPNTDRQQQILNDQPAYGSDPAYQYGQQQIPSSTTDTSIHNTYAPQMINQSQQRVVPSQSTQTGMNLAYAQGNFNPPQMIPSGTDGMTSYRNNTAFNNPSTASGIPRVHASGGQPTLPATFLGAPLSREGYPQQSDYYQMESDASVPALPQAKRARGHVYKEDQEDGDGDTSQDQKDANKNKLARACARCKTLKVRCEAKTDTEPCKRCFNGGHECVIPGRKIRRTPPKREFLLSQIQSQAAEIERLMMQLERMNAAAGSPQVPSLRESTSPGATPGTVYTELQALTIDEGENGANGSNAAANKAVEDWIAKARESLHEFGTFIGIRGAGMPKSYLVDDSDSDDEEFVDVQEELDENLMGPVEDRYGFDVQGPNGVGTPYQEGSTPRTQNLRHHSSNSSIGTVGTPGANPMPRPKKLGNDYLEKPANLPGGASPFGLFGRLGLQPGPNSRAASAEPEEDAGPGIANEDFFKPTPAPNALDRRLENPTHQAPAILTRGIITPQEAEHLFKIYFDNMNLSVSLLDPVLYTAQRTFYRSPFLFTVVCAIASRFYTERPDLYSKIMHYAQLMAGNALITGSKNVEMCQAYILLSLYPVPAKKWEDQRSWLYLGLAIRTATDINLHLPTTAKPVNENHAREMLNRTRVWLNCFNLDRSTGSQYGKPPIISSADYIANHCQDWWESSPYNMEHFDIHICAYNAELKVMSAFIAKINSNPDHPTGLNKNVEFERIATETDDQLKDLMDFWFEKIYKTDMSDPQNNFRTGLLRLAYSYSRLVALSYGFQHAFGKRDVDENPFLMRCLKAASDVVEAVINDICRPSQIHYFRHGPEAQSVFVTFASAFLVKLLQPKFAAYLTQETRAEIRSLVQKVIDLLGSPKVAIDERHGPKLYSRFLEKLLAKPMARLDQPTTRTDITSPASTTSGLPRQRVPGRPQKPLSRNGTPEQSMSSFDVQAYNQSSPATHSSLSPPPTESALSFDQFAPTGPTDPFALDSAAASIAASNSVDVGNMDNLIAGDFFQPPLPFDTRIVQSLQDLTNPSGWQDISLPGFDWMAQFQRNLGLDISNLGPDVNAIYDQNMDYGMAGPSNGH